MYLLIYFLFLRNFDKLEAFTKQMTTSGIESRVVGGKPVDISAFPHLVQFFNKNNLCAGSILNRNIVLTAAHCFDLSTSTDEMIIQAGGRYILDRGAPTYDVLDFILHEDYNKTRLFSCDIALILIVGFFTYGKKIAPARVVNHDRWMKQTERMFFVAGWGWTKYGGPMSEKGLLVANLKYIPLEICDKMHQTNFTSDMFCLYGNGIRDACKGDSGGAISWKGMIVGIVSHGDGCAFSKKPSIYSNIYYFRNWMDKGISKLSDIYCKHLRLY